MPGTHPISHNDAAPPQDELLTLESLPPPDTTRWVARRKAQVVAAVQSGLLTLDEALTRYTLSLEEFTSWQRALYRHGLRGLQVTHLQVCQVADRERQEAERRGGKRGFRWSRQHA
jgi:hypothetical protein